MTEINYEEDIRIDCEALDVEWIYQPELMRRYTKYAAFTKQQLDAAKERMDVGKARIEMEIRKNPQEFGIDKATESAIQSTILLQEEYQTLSQNHINARYENDIANGAVRAMDQKKTALENLVKLLSASYFAAPQAVRNLSNESQEWLKEKERRMKNAKVRITSRKRKNRKKEEKEEE